MVWRIIVVIILQMFWLVVSFKSASTKFELMKIIYLFFATGGKEKKMANRESDQIINSWTSKLGLLQTFTAFWVEEKLIPIESITHTQFNAMSATMLHLYRVSLALRMTKTTYYNERR